MRDVDGLGVEREPPRAQAGDGGEARAVVDLDEQVLAFLGSHGRCPLRFSCGFGHGAEAHQRVIGAAVGLAAHVGDREAQIDQAVVGERQRRVVERLQQRAGDQMRLAVAALARPGVQRDLVLLAGLGAGREIGRRAPRRASHRATRRAAAAFVMPARRRARHEGRCGDRRARSAALALVTVMSFRECENDQSRRTR